MVCLKFVCEIAMPAANAPIIPAIPRISAKYTKAKQMTREMDTTGSVTFNLIIILAFWEQGNLLQVKYQ